MSFLKRFLIALINLVVGILVGLLILEVVIRTNPRLLLRGMSVPSPVDSPLTTQEYDVHYSDADLFYWRPDLIHPVAPKDNKIEAHVQYVTDEFGFRNQPPTPHLVDVVALGTSFTVGAQVQKPWIDWLAEENHWKALNLAQPASVLDTQLEYFQNYGLSHHPRWVIIEIIPLLSILSYQPTPNFILQQLPSPFLQQYARKTGVWPPTWTPGTEIYPLTVELSTGTIQLTCCIHLMDFMTVNTETLLKSKDWKLFSEDLLKIVEEAKVHGVCVAILHGPNKPVVYFPIALHPEELEPVLANIHPLEPDPEGHLSPNSNLRANIETLITNAYAGNEVLATFAKDHNLVFIDPTAIFQEAILNGTDPYMVYDSHLNAFGHQILAQLVSQKLQSANCSNP